MLTKEQKIKLENLRKDCTIPKLKEILNDVIPKWINDDVIPEQGCTGIIDEFGIFRKNPFARGCCLLGASLLNCENPKKYTKEDFLNKKYNFSNKQLHEIAATFDGGITKQQSEVTDYVKSIRVCIFRE